MPRPRASADRKLLQIKLPTRSFERLEAMRERTQAPSLGDVVLRALRLYDACLDEMGTGATVWIEKDDGTRIKAFLQ